MSQGSSPTSGPPQPATGGGIDFGAAAGGAPQPTAPSGLGGIGATPIAPPSAATSAYQFQQYVGGAQGIKLGAQMAAILGLDAGGTYSGDEILQAYYSLNVTELTTLNSLLNAAGFYQSPAGSTVTSNLNFGAFNNDNFAALASAILASNNAKMDMSTLLSKQIASGAGYLQQEGATSPLLGGGNTYQINLTSPQDVYQQAYQTFESALGRAPTPQELKALTSTLQAQERTYQQGQNTQAEQMSQSKYQQQVNARTAMQTPLTATGPISNGPFKTPADAAVAVLQAMGTPISASNVQFVAAWIQSSGGLDSLTHNLLGVTTGQTNQRGQTTFNNWAAGIQASVDMLSSPKFANLRAILSTGDASGQFAKDKNAQSELSTWSDGKITSLDTNAQAADAGRAVQDAQTQHQASGGTGDLANFMGPVANRAPDLTNYMGPVANRNPGSPGGAAQQMLAPSQISGGQGIPSQADSYLPANTLTSIAPPSASAAAFTAATTGPNAVPYLGNQYLNAYASILAMIKQGGPTG